MQGVVHSSDLVLDYHRVVVHRLWVWGAMEVAVLLGKGLLQRWVRAKTRWMEAPTDSRPKIERAPLVVERPSSLLEVACRWAWVELPRACCLPAEEPAADSLNPSRQSQSDAVLVSVVLRHEVSLRLLERDRVVEAWMEASTELVVQQRKREGKKKGKELELGLEMEEVFWVE